MRDTIGEVSRKMGRGNMEYGQRRWQQRGLGTKENKWKFRSEACKESIK